MHLPFSLLCGLPFGFIASDAVEKKGGLCVYCSVRDSKSTIAGTSNTRKYNKDLSVSGIFILNVHDNLFSRSSGLQDSFIEISCFR